MGIIADIEISTGMLLGILSGAKSLITQARDLLFRIGAADMACMIIARAMMAEPLPFTTPLLAREQIFPQQQANEPAYAMITKTASD